MVIQNHTRPFNLHLIATAIMIVETEKTVGRARASLPKWSNKAKSKKAPTGIKIYPHTGKRIRLSSAVITLCTGIANRFYCAAVRSVWIVVYSVENSSTPDEFHPYRWVANPCKTRTLLRSNGRVDGDLPGTGEIRSTARIVGRSHSNLRPSLRCVSSNQKDSRNSDFVTVLP